MDIPYVMHRPARRHRPWHRHRCVCGVRLWHCPDFLQVIEVLCARVASSR